MKVLTMKKSGAKTIFAFCIALTLFMSHSTLAFAAICDDAPDKVHHFDICIREGTGFVRDGGMHKYLLGYGPQNTPIYSSDCRMTHHYKNCNFYCRYCGLKQEGSRHYHLDSTTHSIDHD